MYFTIDTGNQILQQNIDTQFQIAGKADKLQRALDLCKSLNSMKSLENAVRIAHRMNLSALAEKINVYREVLVLCVFL